MPSSQPAFFVTIQATHGHLDLAIQGMNFYNTYLRGELTAAKLPLVMRTQVGFEQKRLVGLLKKYRGLLFPSFSPGVPEDETLIALAAQAASVQRQLVRAYHEGGTQVELHLSEPDMRMLAQGVEYYSRFLGGQIRVYDLPHEVMVRVKEPDHTITELTTQLQPLLFPTLAPHYRAGIGWSPNPLRQDLQRTYEFYKSIYLFDNTLRGVDNIHSTPVLHYSDYPLPVLTQYTSKTHE